MASGAHPADVLEKKFLSDHDCHPAPMRSELFDDARWKAHMRLLAADWALTRRTGPGHFVKAFADCEKRTEATLKELLSAFADRARHPLRAAEWPPEIIFYLIDDQIRNVRLTFKNKRRSSDRRGSPGWTYQLIPGSMPFWKRIYSTFGWSG